LIHPNVSASPPFAIHSVGRSRAVASLTSSVAMRARMCVAAIHVHAGAWPRQRGTALVTTMPSTRTRPETHLKIGRPIAHSSASIPASQNPSAW